MPVLQPKKKNHMLIEHDRWVAHDPTLVFFSNCLCVPLTVAPVVPGRIMSRSVLQPRVLGRTFEHDHTLVLF